MDVFAKDDALTDIQSWDDYGFRVNNIYMRGSVLCLPQFTLLWDVQHISDVSPESLSPVLMLREPRIRLLLIGTGSRMRNVNPMLFGWFSRRGIAVEHMATKHALSTFNVLNREGRGVAAALVSRKPMSREEASVYRSSAHLPGFAADQLSAAAIAASVVDDGAEASMAGERSPALIDLNMPQISRAGSVRRAAEAMASADEEMDSDEAWEEQQERLRGYTSEARWGRIHTGLEALQNNLPRLQARADQSHGELLEMKQTLQLTGAIEAMAWAPSDVMALRSVAKGSALESLTEGSAGGKDETASLTAGSAGDKDETASLTEGSAGGKDETASLTEGSAGGKDETASLTEGSAGGKEETASLAPGEQTKSE